MAQLHKTRNHIGLAGVAQNRFEIFKDAIDRYNEAMDKEFYLEAIAICESLITDRMESRLGEISNADVSFDTLYNLKEKLVHFPETEVSLSNLYNDIVRVWAPKRNKAMHQVVKISKTEVKVWTDFQLECKDAAVEGMQYFRKLDNELSKIRR